MFIATKTIYTVDKTFLKGNVVPNKYVSDHLIQIGAVIFKEDIVSKPDFDKEVEIKLPSKTDNVDDAKVEVKKEPKVEHVKDTINNSVKPRIKKEFLTEDSSNIKVVKE